MQDRRPDTLLRWHLRRLAGTLRHLIGETNAEMQRIKTSTAFLGR